MKLRNILATLLLAASFSLSALAQDIPDMMQVRVGNSKLVSYWISGLTVSDLKNTGDGIFQGTFELSKDLGYYFCFNTGLYHDQIHSEIVGPGTNDEPVEIYFDVDGSEDFEIKTEPAGTAPRGDCWQWTGPKGSKVTLQATVNWNDMTVVIECIELTEPEENGMEVISAEIEADRPVYNLQGVKVLTAGSPAELRNLPKGIYIVGGKKIAL